MSIGTQRIVETGRSPASPGIPGSSVSYGSHFLAVSTLAKLIWPGNSQSEYALGVHFEALAF